MPVARAQHAGVLGDLACARRPLWSKRAWRPLAAAQRNDAFPAAVDIPASRSESSLRSLPAKARVQLPIGLRTDAETVAALGCGQLPFRLTLSPRLEYSRWK